MDSEASGGGMLERETQVSRRGNSRGSGKKAQGA